MTTKSTANAAHDAARSEDARRAHAELHEYITSLERELADARGTRDESKHRCGWATRAKVAEGERDAARQLAAEREQERALVAERLATTERARNAWLDRCASMEHERDSAKRARDEAQRDRDDAVSNRDEWRHRAEVADHARATLNERLAATERRLAEVTRERDEARAALASLSDALGIRHADDNGATAIDAVRCMRTNYESACERAGWRELASAATLLGYGRGTSPDFGEVDVVKVRDLVARRIHEAQEQGARWAIAEWWHRGLGDCVPGRPEAFEANAATAAARICAEARTKGGE